LFGMASGASSVRLLPAHCRSWAAFLLRRSVLFGCVFVSAFAFVAFTHVCWISRNIPIGAEAALVMCLIRGICGRGREVRWHMSNAEGTSPAARSYFGADGRMRHMPLHVPIGSK
jgi:hypothetical protein